ncbi:MAG: transposase, partial [Oscillospiraceae bacterium]|nr:transposase [Oscillospiraceae bacterium]
MKRSKGSSYIIELPLVTEKFQEDEIDTRMECGRKIYNALVTVTMKRYREMVKTKIYRSLT